jgi:hypothetical protein
MVEKILNHTYNKEKVQGFINLGLDPKYGLSSVVTQLMFDLYEMSSGDSQFNYRFNCSSCVDTVFRKLKDFLNYDDNMGKPLVNWTIIREDDFFKNIME